MNDDFVFDDQAETSTEVFSVGFSFDSSMPSLEFSSGESEEFLSEAVSNQADSLDESSLDSLDEFGIEEPEQVIEAYSVEPFDYELLDSHFQQIHEDLFLIAAILIITFAKGCLRSWREKNVKEVR